VKPGGVGWTGRSFCFFGSGFVGHWIALVFGSEAESAIRPADFDVQRACGVDEGRGRTVGERRGG
jgi:hypothetical protein